MEKGIISKLGKVEIELVRGDITQIDAPAIMTLINSAGLWFGGVDGAINKVAGTYYHVQVADKKPLYDGQVVIAKGDCAKHQGKFNDVIFVVDDLKQSLDVLVYNGLVKAHKAHYKKVLMPAMRTGVMAGVVEKTLQKTISKMGEGIKRFVKEHGKKTALQKITIVIYANGETKETFEKELKLLSSPAD